MSAKGLVASLLLVAGCAPGAVPVSPSSAAAPPPPASAWAATCGDFDEWDKPGPPFRVTGNTYYVGTCGIASLLVVSADGHALIDSGTDEGAKVVLANIRRLGFDPRDVKALLMSHEHFDHVGGIARLQAATGAPIVTTREAAAVLRSGRPGRDDPQADAGHPVFPAVTGEIVALDAADPQVIGDTEFTPVATPGHTPGALSWQWRECAQAACRTIVYVDSLSPIGSDDYRFADHPRYLAEYRASLARVEALECDIVIAPHPSAANLRDRITGAMPLVDPLGCKAYAAAVRERLDQRLAKERGD